MTSAIWQISLLLFAAGLAAVVLRRQLLAMLLGLELMISAANVVLVHHAALFSDPEGFSAVLLIIAVAAAEAVVGLTLILKLLEAGKTAETASLEELGEKQA